MGTARAQTTHHHSVFGATSHTNSDIEDLDGQDSDGNEGYSGTQQI